MAVSTVYVLSGEGAWAPTVPAQRRASTAVEALQAAAAYLRQDHSASIVDDHGRTIPLREVLDVALVEAADPDAVRQLAGALADHLDAALDRDLAWAAAEYDFLDSRDRELELVHAEMEGRPTADLVRRDGAERARLHQVLVGAGIWRRAGELWARDFGQQPPEALLEELARRDPHAGLDDVRCGAEEWLTRAGPPPGRYDAHWRADGWGVWSNQTGALLQMYEDEGAARAHYDALIAGRPWTSRDWSRVVEVGATIAERRREERLRQIAGIGSSPPSSPAAGRHGLGRRL